MQHTQIGIVLVNHHQLRNAVGLHHVESFLGISIIKNTFGIGRHDIGGRKLVDRRIGLEHASKVTIGDNAAYAAVAVGHHCAAKSATGHLKYSVADGGIGRHEGPFILGIEVADAHI